MIEFEIQKGYFKVHDGMTCYDLFIDEQKEFPDLPDPDTVYSICQDGGMTEGQTIMTMLQTFHTKRLFKGGYLKPLSLVFAFVGGRGSGKSCGAAQLASVDFLLDGKTVWSNMDIGLAVRYKDCRKVFKSQNLDKASLMDINAFETQYADGLVLLDEANIEISDSRRSMSNTMLWFDYTLQEVRKRRMNICYTVQDEEWVGKRSRFQTDLYVVCHDHAFLDKQRQADDIGRHSRWRVHDMSGCVTGELKYRDGHRHFVDHFKEVIVWNTPFWKTYDSGQMQKYEKYDPSKARSGNDNKLVIDQEAFKRLSAGYSILPEMVLKIIDSGYDRIPRDDLWAILNVTDHSTKTKVGELLNSLGCESYRITGNRYGYRIPDKETLKDRLDELGISHWKKGA